MKRINFRTAASADMRKVARETETRDSPQPSLGRQKWCTQRRGGRRGAFPTTSCWSRRRAEHNSVQHPSRYIDRRVETRNGPWSRRRVCTNKFRATGISVYAPQYPKIVIPAKAGTHGLLFPHAIRFCFARRHEDPEQLLYAFLPLCEPFCR